MNLQVGVGPHLAKSAGQYQGQVPSNEQHVEIHYAHTYTYIHTYMYIYIYIYGYVYMVATM